MKISFGFLLLRFFCFSLSFFKKRERKCHLDVSG
jgi:hypothetical protein